MYLHRGTADTGMGRKETKRALERRSWEAHHAAEAPEQRGRAEPNASSSGSPSAREYFEKEGGVRVARRACPAVAAPAAAAGPPPSPSSRTRTPRTLRGSATTSWTRSWGWGPDRRRTGGQGTRGCRPGLVCGGRGWRRRGAGFGRRGGGAQRRGVQSSGRGAKQRGISGKFNQRAWRVPKIRVGPRRARLRAPKESLDFAQLSPHLGEERRVPDVRTALLSAHQDGQAAGSNHFRSSATSCSTRGTRLVGDGGGGRRRRRRSPLHLLNNRPQLAREVLPKLAEGGANRRGELRRGRGSRLRGWEPGMSAQRREFSDSLW